MTIIIYAASNKRTRQQILEFSGLSEGKLPFRYLGVPLSSQKLTLVQWQPLIQKILSKITCWTARFLSYAGRLQLIKSVLFGMQTYWSQVFLLPQKVVKSIQTACRVFLWTGKAGISKRALVAWERVMQPLQAGGLNVINLKIWNKAALCKLLWCLYQKKDKSWIRWIHGYYIKHADVWEMEIPKQSTWMVRKILGARDYLKELQGGHCWLRNSSFSIKKMYAALAGRPQLIPWAKMMCQNSAPPKCVFISWLLLHEKLVTCAFLKDRGIYVDEVCCLCKKKEELVDHLFFECEFAAAVWIGVARWCGINRVPKVWRVEKEFLIAQCTSNSGKQRAYRCMVSVLVYQIWSERNARRMQAKCRSVEDIVHYCQFLLVTCSQKDRKLARYFK